MIWGYSAVPELNGFNLFNFYYLLRSKNFIVYFMICSQLSPYQIGPWEHTRAGIKVSIVVWVDTLVIHSNEAYYLIIVDVSAYELR